MRGVSGYRRLLKSVQYAFKGDTFALSQARTQLREEFSKNKMITDNTQLEELFAGVEEVDEMLRFNIVQGRLNGKGNYEVGLTSAHAVTVEAGQGSPHGPELTRVDRSILGEADSVVVTKTRGTNSRASSKSDL